ncbi:hypothetical protein [Streptomyces caeruleatus]|uniref:Uncharacterized protein n=1 Tax=Streptomyces caeruleatus TaxID=661399 RepID=A0A101TT26_9ACTN|nr:hypothetical protein [Streptomyces caeruleatus]KUN97960.1 hypothetical protein AQJ67_28705 [Streptomyces caeruleatus]
MTLTPRIKKRIAQEYAEQDQQAVEDLLLELIGELEQEVEEERIIAAALLCAQGRVDGLLNAAETTRRDWRNILAAAGLAHKDWPERLDSEFGANA